MKKYGKAVVTAIVCSAFMTAAAACAANGDDILGLWYNEERDGIIEVFKCGEKYCGRVVWAKESTYPPNDKTGRGGQARTDENNPAPELRKRPIIGLRIMGDFTFDGANSWTGGAVYDPKNGKTYSGKITLISPDELRLRGYVLFSFLGRTTTWKRTDHLPE